MLFVAVTLESAIVEVRVVAVCGEAPHEHEERDEARDHARPRIRREYPSAHAADGVPSARRRWCTEVLGELV